MGWIYLSHFLSEETPGFGGTYEFSRQAKKSISSGDSSNSFEFRMLNHHGTHMDLPKHFVDGGKSMADYKASDFVFQKVGLVHYPASVDEILTSKILSGVPTDIELLLLKTDWTRFRGRDRYWKNNPGLAPEFAKELRSKFSEIRAIGFDFISLTAFQHRELGRQAHRDFLGGTQPILIIEDMNLTSLENAPTKVIVAPLLIDKADGAPVTVIAEL
jgi:arylformamidase